MLPASGTLAVASLKLSREGGKENAKLGPATRTLEGGGRREGYWEPGCQQGRDQSEEGRNNREPGSRPERLWK